MSNLETDENNYENFTPTKIVDMKKNMRAVEKWVGMGTLRGISTEARDFLPTEKLRLKIWNITKKLINKNERV